MQTNVLLLASAKTLLVKLDHLLAGLEAFAAYDKRMPEGQ